MSASRNKKMPAGGRLAKAFLDPNSKSRDQSLILGLSALGIRTPKGAYAIRVNDNGMSGAGITKGDIAIVVPAAPRCGDIVAACLKGTIFLRRFELIRGMPHLLTENTDPAHCVAAPSNSISGVLW